ncbi:hypothetical protein ABVK25_010357 [Lepraria finkii]|uniref:Uncharacterized protein n=1 Tax=Lepraria finkii TaxID=1340010 RepID=A0ABR4AUH3_9LECA
MAPFDPLIIISILLAQAALTLSPSPPHLTPPSPASHPQITAVPSEQPNAYPNPPAQPTAAITPKSATLSAPPSQQHA